MGRRVGGGVFVCVCVCGGGGGWGEGTNGAFAESKTWLDSWCQCLGMVYAEFQNFKF